MAKVVEDSAKELSDQAATITVPGKENLDSAMEPSTDATSTNDGAAGTNIAQPDVDMLESSSAKPDKSGTEPSNASTAPVDSGSKPEAKPEAMPDAEMTDVAAVEPPSKPAEEAPTPMPTPAQEPEAPITSEGDPPKKIELEEKDQEVELGMEEKEQVIEGNEVTMAEVETVEVKKKVKKAPSAKQTKPKKEVQKERSEKLAKAIGKISVGKVSVMSPKVTTTTKPKKGSAGKTPARGLLGKPPVTSEEKAKLPRGKRKRESNDESSVPVKKRKTPDKKKSKTKESKKDSKKPTPSKGILKKLQLKLDDTGTPSKVVEPKSTRSRSLDDLIESPALFDREYVRKATKEELLIACGPAGLLPSSKRNRTCKNLRTALESTRAEIVKNLNLNNPILLLKNMGKHTFYRVSVTKVDSPGGGEVEKEKQYELRCEWGAVGMKKSSKFLSDDTLLAPLPKARTLLKYFATKEDAEAAARRIITVKDSEKGYYLSMADNLAGVDEHPQVTVSDRTICFAKTATVQPFRGCEKPKRATKMPTSSNPAKK